MYLNLFQCMACDETGPDSGSLPLCQLCLDSLIPCPPLCAQCTGLACSPAQCSRPWIQQPPGNPIRSFSARYLLIGQGFRVLKRWKTHSGLAFDRRVLGRDLGRPFRESTALKLGTAGAVVVAIPQDPRRSRSLGGNPAERIAYALARITGLEVQKVLQAPELRSGPRQAERSATERLESPMKFRATGPCPKRIILVDDFMTTGHTLRSAAAALARAGTREVDVFCLGFRPPLDRGPEKRIR